MSLIDKSLGESETNAAEKQPDIDVLLSSSDTNGAIIEIDSYVCQLCAHGDELERLTDPQKVFYFNQNLEREVNNGGFDQYFFNSSGDFAHETIESLLTIGAQKTAQLLKQAIDQFPGSMVPPDRDERWGVMEKIGDSSEEIWNGLDQEFYRYVEDLNELNIEHIRKNRSSF